MYIPPSFTLTTEAARTFIEARGFGLLVTQTESGLDTTPLPLIIVDNTLIGHVAKANPVWKREGRAMVLFSGADGYISPSWYATKAETGKVVPTWNYELVQVQAMLSAVHETEQKRKIVSALTDRHEAAINSKWSIADAPEDYIDSMLNAIVGITLEIESIEGKAKLSQNQPEPNQIRVRAAVSGTPLAKAMNV
jgi:transcriptional regulator